MRVLLIYQFFGPYHVARFHHWFESARKLGWEPIGLQVFQRPDLYNWSPGQEIGEITNLGMITGGGDTLRWRDVPRMAKSLKSMKPDVVVVNGWGMRDAIVTHFWCRLHGIRRILVTDSQEGDFSRRWYKEGIKQRIIEGAASVFVAGAPQRRYAMNLGFDEAKITDGCDVVDNAHFYPARQKRNSTGCRILTVARWSPEKNLVAAAEAFLDFLQGRPESEAWTWKLAGYGPLEAELREYARRSGGRIQLLGAKDYSELPLTFADADLYWQPSLREPWALVVNEAMASGLPLLVSNRCGCHEDLVTAETGWTFDPTSHEGMVQALETAAASHPQWPEMGAASARLIERWGLERFSDGLNRAIRIATQR